MYCCNYVHFNYEVDSRNWKYLKENVFSVVPTLGDVAPCLLRGKAEVGCGLSRTTGKAVRIL